MTGFTGVPITLDSKAKAVQYAISIAMQTDRNGKLTVDLVLATGIYNFITERIDLPDLPKDTLTETCTPLLEVIKQKLEKLEV